MYVNECTYSLEGSLQSERLVCDRVDDGSVDGEVRLLRHGIKHTQANEHAEVVHQMLLH
jgi:hypothetical protein